MKSSLQLRTSQHLALTPQLQQSIRLLQLSTLELNQELEQALSDNPLLERLDDPLDEFVRLSASGSIESSSPRTTASEAGGGESGDDATAPDEGFDAGRDSPDDDLGSDWGAEPGARTPHDDEDDREIPQLATTGRTLRDHLMAQLASTQCSPLDRGLVTLLIDNLDDDGLLDTGLDEIATLLPEEIELETESLPTALKLLQSFDPAGVGGRDLSECLLLQISNLPPPPLGPAADRRDLASRLVREHLPLMAARDFTRLKRALGCDEDSLRDAQTLVRSLNPRPGAAFSIDEPTYVVPDVLVKRTRSGWQAQLNPDVVPKLRINEIYARILRRNRAGGAGGLSTQLQEARWLIKNVQQRFETILRVSSAIVERQRAFFSHGEVAMRPLVLREIAEELGLHESTISRVTTQKFMLTPFGTFELKYFFGSHVATDAGGAASSTAIRALIKQLVANEDPQSPLSDSQIADLLGKQGIVVARRTVAKYREASLIPPVSQRKVL